MGIGKRAARRSRSHRSMSDYNFEDINPEISDCAPDVRRHDYTAGRRGSVSVPIVSVDVEAGPMISIVSDRRQRDTVRPHCVRLDRSSHLPNTARYWTSADEPFRVRVIDTCAVARVAASKNNPIALMIIKIHETARLRINKNMFPCPI